LRLEGGGPESGRAGQGPVERHDWWNRQQGARRGEEREEVA
jgi:hypothetical protein